MYRVCHPDKKQSGSNDTKMSIYENAKFLGFLQIGSYFIFKDKASHCGLQLLYNVIRKIITVTSYITLIIELTSCTMNIIF